MMLSGSCLCGAVRYQIAGPLKMAGHCHCSICRKAHGAAFATWTMVRTDQFEWLAGEEYLHAYSSSPDRQRLFCGECGTPIAATHNGHIGEVVLASLDDEPGIRPREHIFVGSRACWHEITDALPQFVQWPPGLEPATT